MDVDGNYTSSPTLSLEKGANNDPFTSYLSTGHVQFMVENDITTPEKRCPQSKRWSYVRSRNIFFKCEYCPYETKYRQDLRRHVKRHANPSHVCKDCNMPFNCAWPLKKHIVEAHSNGDGLNQNSSQSGSFPKYKDIAQSVCDASNKSRRRLWKCDMCDYSTEHEPVYRKHKNRHLAEGALHCKYCNHPFARRNKMLLHIRKKHGNDSCSQHGKTRSKRTTDVESLLDGVRKAKVMFERRKEYIYNDNESVDGNEETDVNLKQKHIATAGEMFKQRKSVRKVEFSKNDDTNEEASTDREHAGPSLVNCLQERFINYLNCVFCGYVATSYSDLKEHLDVHDNEYVRTDTDNGDGLFLIPESSSGVFHSHVNDNVAAGDINSVLPSQDKGVNNDFAILETKNDCNEMYIATKYIPIPEQTDEIIPSAQQEERSRVESVGDEDEDSRDAMNMYGECVSKVGKIPDDEFIMKPFACAKCFFTTGNINHLKIHVEAHLYEKAREAYSVAKRRVVVTHIGTGSGGYSVDEQTGIDNNVPECVDDIHVPADGQRMETEDMDNTITNEKRLQHVIDSSDENNTDNANVTITDTDEGFCDKDSESNPDKHSHSEVEEQQGLSYIGRLSKEEFRKTKRLYKTFSDGEAQRSYECSICESDNYFENRAALKEHFRLNHMDLRERLCSSCKHCSKPFP